MKKFEKLKLQKTIMNKVIGGVEPVATSESYENEEGCQVTRTDSYDDCNGNGVWDSFESGTSSTITKC